MSFVSKAVIFSLIVAGLAYWWATNFNIPEGLEQKSEVAWIYGAAKIGMFLAELGEKIGLGHRAILLRKLASVQFLESKKSIHADIKKYKDSFAGVEVLIIEPTEKDPYGPALVWIHGGGWVLGSAEMDTEFLEELSKAMKMVIVSIEYRMAPEFPYPTPLDDCFAATKHFIENALDHNVDPFRIAVGGMSAGGNLAAALSMKIRDSNLTWKFKLQILGVPCLQAYRFDTPSYNQNYLDEILSRPSMTNYWLWYAFGSEGHLLLDDFLEGRHQKVIDPNGKLAPFVDWKSLGIKSPSTTTSDPASSSATALSKESEKEIEKLKGVLVDPLYAPLLARNLSGLPATYLITAEFDVLRDEGMMYGERLKRQGVETKMMHYQGAFHDILLWTEHYNVSKRILRDIVDYLKVKL